MNKLLYIGLNGLAGSGKDTVAKMFKTILSRKWESMEECKSYYFSTYTNPTQSATYPVLKEEHTSVMCIAYADQLKEICASIFGIPLGRFYQNKANAWICINDKFQYTEIKPNEQNIITADEYYYNLSSYSNDNVEKYWMSLREILVYVGTYVLQMSINKQIFVNIVRNKIREEQYHNHNLEFVIITDHRFIHEIEYIYENHGITVTITRDTVSQLDNIAEHDLDEENDYDYIINNSGSYDELFETVWNIVNEEIEFKNITIDLYTRDNVNNYLRLAEENDHRLIYKLCVPYHVQKLYKTDGEITMIDPIGGPIICVGEKIEGTDIVPNLITLDDKRNEFLIWVNKDKEL